MPGQSSSARPSARKENIFNAEIGIQKQNGKCSLLWRYEGDRSIAEKVQGLLNQLVSGLNAFPDLDDVTVEYVESEFGLEKRRGVFSVRGQGRQMRCGNSHCSHGGYEFDRIIDEMVSNNEKQREIELHCKRGEGAHKVGGSCKRHIRGVIRVKQKQLAKKHTA